MKYELKTLSYIVKPELEAVFSEQATIISIEDEAGGEFLKITQNSEHNSKEHSEVRFCFDEWKYINKAANKLIKEWSSLEKPSQ